MKQLKTHDVRTKLVSKDKDRRTLTNILREECEEDGRESWHESHIIAQEDDDDDPQND